MIKKIRIDQLRLGMFIHDLNVSWLNHPFFGKTIRVENDYIIDKIVRYGIKEMLIDTDKGLDVKYTPVKEENNEEGETEVYEMGEEERLNKIKQVSISEELLNAKRIRQETVQAVQKIINDIKMGGKIEREKIEPLIDNIIASVLRNQDAIVSLGRLRKTNDYVYHHSLSVCALMTAFSRYLGFSLEEIRDIGFGAIMHDVGTAKIPFLILTKTSPLNEEEYEIIKKHVEYSLRILEKTNGVTETALLTAGQHHERVDGKGYPKGLKGDEISKYGQAIGIIDVYDALTTKRCYKRRIPPTEALKLLYQMGGIQFNKDMVEKFIRFIGIYPVGSLVRLESGLLGIVIDHSEDNPVKPIVRIVYNTKTKTGIYMPYDLDLSKTVGKGSGDSIVTYESPEKWDILPEVYL